VTDNGHRHRDVQLDDVSIHVVEQGSGPLVLLVHGFPETSYSWRHQLPVLAEAGYRAAAIDVRGYGHSTQPEAIDAYRMMRHVADNVGVVEALGADEAVIVGHDWGSPIAAASALLRPDLFTAVALLSVPYMPPSHRRPTEAIAELAGDRGEFYITYFQVPGRAEAEAAEDLRRWLVGFYFGASGEAPPEAASFGVVPEGVRMMELFAAPDGEMSWLPDADLDYYVAEFERTGVAGGLNRYRNLDRDWEDLAALRGQPIRVPSLFIGGDKDGPVIWGAGAIARFGETLPDLRGQHILPGCGHWTQQERPEEVNELLLGFLAEVRPTAPSP
jgi:pimeloyl-ACP methyl ester carboxylesterase